MVIRKHADPEKWGVAWLGDDGRLTAHPECGVPPSDG